MIAVRALLRHKGFTTVSVISVALSLALAVVMAGVLDAVAHPPVPYEHVDGLVRLQFHGRSNDALRGIPAQALSALPSLQGFTTVDRLLVPSASSGDAARLVSAAVVAPNYFTLLGLKPAIGRVFAGAESGAEAVVSEDVWRTLLGGSEHWRETQLTLNGATYTVVGVVADEVALTTGLDVWVRSESVANTVPFTSEIIARIRTGRSTGNSQTEVRSLLQRLQSSTSAGAHGRAARTVAVRPLRPDPLRYSDYHLALSGAVLAVLIIACANVAALLLMRGLARRRELSVRVALGASRWDLVRQLLAESTLITLIAGGIGLLLSEAVIHALRERASEISPGVLLTPQFSWRVLVAGLALTAFTAAICGLIPALVSSRVDPGAALKDGSGTTTPRSGSRLSGMVVAEFALAMILLVCGGLLAKSVYYTANYDFGYDMRGLVQFTVLPPNSIAELQQARSRHDSDAESRAVAAVAAATRSTLDAVKTSAIASNAALVARRATPQRRVVSDAGQEAPITGYSRVSRDFFQTLEIPIVRGRNFDRNDGAGHRVAIIDERAARQLWPSGQAVGRTINLDPGGEANEWIRVIGVAQSARFTLPADLTSETDPYIAVLDDSSDATPGGTIVVRGRRMGALPARLHSVVQTAVPGAVMTPVEPWAPRLNGLIHRQQIFVALFAGFSIIAILLAAAGMYSVVAYAVTQRQREFAVRAALGASSTQLIRTVAAIGAVMVLGGTAIGTLGAIWSARLINSLLYGVYSVDATVLVAVEALLFTTAVLACWRPARRAATADPVTVLRST